MSRGSEDQFQKIVESLAGNCRSYEGKQLRYYQFAEQVDNIFSSYGWNKKEFYKELNERLGISTNETRPKKNSSVPPPNKKKKAAPKN